MIDLYINKETLAVFGLFVYSAVSLFIYGDIKQKKQDRKTLFFIALIKGFKNKSLENITDLLNIYMGVTNLSSEDLSYRFGLNAWLREFLVEIIAKQESYQLEDSEVFLLKGRISKFIETNEEKSPFSDLPDTERSILNDIKAFLKNGESEMVESKIIELGKIIQTRYLEQKKLLKNNKWSIPLAVAGVATTIIFGIIPIFAS